MFSVLDNLTPFMLGALKRARQVSPSVGPSAVKLLKIYNPEYALVIHPEKVASRKHVGNGHTTLGIYLSAPTRPSVQLVFGGDSFY